MNKIIFLLLLLYSTSIFGQLKPITVKDKTVKVSGKELLRAVAAFEEGDKVAIDFEVIKGKSVKEVEFGEYGESSFFSDYKVKKLNKVFNISKRGIYVFRINNTALFGKVCKITMKRTPANESTKDFNSEVVWETEYDTSYVKKYRKKLIKVDTALSTILTTQKRILGDLSLNGSNTSWVRAVLPQNKYTDLISSSVSKLPNPYAVTTGLLLNLYGNMSSPPKGDNIRFDWYRYDREGNKILFDAGNTINAYKRNTELLQGTFDLLLYNDNVVNGINVDVKIIADIVTKNYVNESYEEMNVKTTKYPVMQD